MLLIDSADVDDVARAAALGYVAGVTTNPSLVARAGGEPETLVRALLGAARGPLFYQPASSDAAVARDEARRMFDLAPGRVVVKLPARRDFFTLAAELGRAGVPCAMTAVYAPAQALLAAECGCRWVIPYVDRAARLAPDAPRVVPRLAAVVARAAARPRILAASLKTPEQVVEAIVDGADAVTAPLAVIEALSEHPLSAGAIAEFDDAVRGRLSDVRRGSAG